MTDKSHLLRFGYAPGNYWFVCNDCGNKRAEGDKRSTRCEACAETLYSQVTSVEAVSDKHRGTPMTIPDEAVQAAWVAHDNMLGYSKLERHRAALTAALPFLTGAASPRAQALEEAARLADAQADKIDLTGMDRTRSITKYLAAQKVALLDAAAAIRALSSKPVAGRCKTVDELAAYLCDEFDFDLNPVRGASWPEHENDEGKRDGGYVRLQPSDVQAYARENAKRILAFLGLPASPGASE